jgi:hypothetical protein
MGALSSAFFLLGSSLLYGFSGTINFSEFFVLCVTDEPLVFERGYIMHFFSYPLVFYYLWLTTYYWDTTDKIVDAVPFAIDCQRAMGQRLVYIHFILQFLIAGLTFIHLTLLHKVGSTSPLGSDNGIDDVPFYPYYGFKRFIRFIMFFSCFCYFCIIFS